VLRLELGLGLRLGLGLEGHTESLTRLEASLVMAGLFSTLTQSKLVLHVGLSQVSSHFTVAITAMRSRSKVSDVICAKLT